MSNIKVFGGSSHPELVKLICEKLNLPVGKAKCTKFANGETNGKFFSATVHFVTIITNLVEIQESVRGEDVFIVQVLTPEFNCLNF